MFCNKTYVPLRFLDELRQVDNIFRWGHLAWGLFPYTTVTSLLFLSSSCFDWVANFSFELWTFSAIILSYNFLTFSPNFIYSSLFSVFFRLKKIFWPTCGKKGFFYFFNETEKKIKMLKNQVTKFKQYSYKEKKK